MSIISSPGNTDDIPPDGYGIKQGLGIQRWPSPTVVLASATYHWPLTHVSRLLDVKCVSDGFSVSGYTWRLKFCAKGADSGKAMTEETCASLFVENMETSQTGGGPIASFALGVVNQDDPEKSLWRNCEHAFNARMPDWGFERLILLRDLIDPDRGFVVNDTMVVGIRF